MQPARTELENMSSLPEFVFLKGKSNLFCKAPTLYMYIMLSV